MPTITETVYLGFDNEIELLIEEDGVPMPFVDRGTSRVDVLLDSGEVVSSTSGLISFDNVGNVKLRLGPALSAPGAHTPKLVMYTALEPDGVVLMSKFSPTKLVINCVG